MKDTPCAARPHLRLGELIKEWAGVWPSGIR